MFFKTHQEFLDCVELNAGIDFLSITPSIKSAELKFLKPLLGAAYYDALYVRYDTNTIVIDAEEELIVHIQNAVANLALYLYVPITEGIITDAGIRRGNSESSPGAFKYQVKELQKGLLERGFEYLEIILSHMDESPQSHVEWYQSATYKNYRKLFILNGNEFEQYYSAIRYPHRMFTLLRTTMSNVQELSIAASITPTIYNALIAEAINPSPNYSAEAAMLLQYLKPAIAHLTVARGIAQIVATMDENGVHILTQFNDTTTDTGKRAPASNVHLTMLIKEAESVGQAWLAKAIEYLNTTASETVFSSWYTTLQAADEAIPENDELLGCFGL